ncbi:MAG: DUF1924 domain-containing protein [Hyphomicrobiaceae bacterium]|nr:DUF1924 domain-containing protein [Hyphomicrobiaceae bacterium]
MRTLIIPLAATILLSATLPGVAGPAQDEILKHFQEQAKMEFSVERGQELFTKSYGTGKPKTPSCTTCHTKSPLKSGKTRVGKVIAPMALSRTKDRYSDLKKVEKWFRRNCKGVIGRECTPQEKVDFLAFMISK